MSKVLGTENPADMNTKGLNWEQIDKFVRMLNMEHREGRAELAPELCKIIHQEHCNRYNSASKKVTKRVRFENVNVESNKCLCMDRQCTVCCTLYLNAMQSGVAVTVAE